jgi:hypothetical protein
VSGEQLTGGAGSNGLATAATCAGCGAPLVADQRYCLACGEPASPVRLAFLDVLQAEYRPAPDGGTPVPPGGQVYAAYAPAPEPDGLLGALRRYSGLLALVGVLLASLLIGLLVGHWASGGGSGAAGKQVVEVKIPGGLLAGAAPVASGSGGAGASGTGSGAAGDGSSGGAKAGGTSGAHAAASSAKTESAAEEAKAEKEVKAATAPPPVKKKASSGTLQKLEHSTGKQHEKEVSKLISGDEPIETH